MSTTYVAAMGDRGRLVVPAELRAKQHWDLGTPLLFIETGRGVVLATREQAKRALREQLAGADLVGELLSERRSEASVDDRT